MAYVMISGFLCERCAHRWIRKQPQFPEPKVCPKCMSPYWNTQRPRPLRPDVGPLRNDWTINREAVQYPIARPAATRSKDSRQDHAEATKWTRNSTANRRLTQLALP